MKRIAIASAVVALAGIGAGSALADNTGVQVSNVGQASQATSAAVNTPTWSAINVNLSHASSGNAASVVQVLKQFNLGF